MKRLIQTLFSILFVAGFTFQASAVTHIENDAGPLRSNAELITFFGTDVISGSFSSDADCDVYKFALDRDFVVAIQTTSSIDTCLLLFDSQGRGLEGDDDDGIGNQALISRLLPAGVYYLAVSSQGAGLEAFANSLDLSNRANHFLDDDDGALGNPTVQRLYGVSNGGGGATGNYSIGLGTFTSAGTIPVAGGGEKKSFRTHGPRFKISSRKRTIRAYFTQFNTQTPAPLFNQFKLPPSSSFRSRIFSRTGGRKNVTAELIAGKAYVVDAYDKIKYEALVKNVSKRREARGVVRLSTVSQSRFVGRGVLLFGRRSTRPLHSFFLPSWKRSWIESSTKGEA